MNRRPPIIAIFLIALVWGTLLPAGTQVADLRRAADLTGGPAGHWAAPRSR